MNLPDVRDAINRRVTRLLTIAEAALPPAQFQAFRKITLNEFGESGLLAELRARRTGKETSADD